MDLAAITTVFSRRKATIALTTLITVSLAMLATTAIDETFEASTTLRLATAVGGSINSVDYDIAYTDRLMNTYSEIVTSDSFVFEVAHDQGLSDTPDVEVEIAANTELMRVSAASGDPEDVAAFVDALASRLATTADETANDTATSEALAELLDDLEEALAQARAEYESVSDQFEPQSPQVALALRSVESAEDRYMDLRSGIRTRAAIETTSLIVIEPASVPTEASSPSPMLLVIACGLAGMVAGVGLAFVEDHLDKTLRSTTEVERVLEGRIDAIGFVPRLKPGLRQWFDRVGPDLASDGPDDIDVGAARNDWRSGFARARSSLTPPKLTVTEAGFGPTFDQSLRRVRTVIEASVPHRVLGSILVVSAESGAGTSTIATNLARSFAVMGDRVLAVEGNIGAPSFSAVFQVPEDPGLVSLQAKENEWPSLVQKTNVAGVDVITAGRGSAPLEELVASPAVEELMRWAKSEYDVVILDAAPLDTSADGLVLAALVDGVVLVVAPGVSRKDSVIGAIRQLDAMEAPVVGAVVNMDTSSSAPHPGAS